MQPFEVTILGKPEAWLLEAAASIGLDFSALSHEETNFFRNHVRKRHGQGVLAILDTDFGLIPAIVKAPDMAIIGTIRKGAIVNAYAKREAGRTYLYFDEAMNSTHHKALRSRTFYKIVKPLDMEGFEKIVIMNGISDLSMARKVIAAGGRPGGEA
ncbi:MAG: hypothetical protein LBK08_05910 [Treponema sp.]|nr:hypothetical protein [Treponema sp.]